MLGGAVDDHDTMVGREPVAELSRRNQSAGASAEDDSAADRADGAAGAPLHRGRAPDHLLDRDREA